MPDMNGRENYLELDALIGGWFHQDIDIYGNCLDDVLLDFRRQVDLVERLKVASNIYRFLSVYGISDGDLAVSFERIFEPDVVVEGWNGMTTRQWLEYVTKFIES